MNRENRRFSSRFAAAPGTYALVLRVAARAAVLVGRLGAIELRRGWYVYVGSARGPGGLRARLAHHLRPVARPHWHIDYLRQCGAAEVCEVWSSLDAGDDEHGWSHRLAWAASEMPAAGFGSSDCRCPAHFLYFSQRPAATLLGGPARRRVTVSRPLAPPS